MRLSFERIRGLVVGIEYMPDEVVEEQGMLFCAFIHLGFIRAMVYKDSPE